MSRTKVREVLGMTAYLVRISLPLVGSLGTSIVLLGELKIGICSCTRR